MSRLLASQSRILGRNNSSGRAVELTLIPIATSHLSPGLHHLKIRIRAKLTGLSVRHNRTKYHASNHSPNRHLSRSLASTSSSSNPQMTITSQLQHSIPAVSTNFVTAAKTSPVSFREAASHKLGALTNFRPSEGRIPQESVAVISREEWDRSGEAVWCKTQGSGPIQAAWPSQASDSNSETRWRTR